MDKKNEVTDKPLFDNLRKLINLIDSFRDVGLHEHIELPRIAVLGIFASIQEHSQVVNHLCFKILSDLTSCLEVQVSSLDVLSNLGWST